MAIKIPLLESLAEKDVKNYTYKDIALDIERIKTTSKSLIQSPLFGVDIRASYDTEAIANSLYNLFNTKKGERFLFPEYGTDLDRFLFSPLTEITAKAVGIAIQKAIKTYEPRVKVDDVQMFIVEEDNSLIANINLTINVTKQTTSVTMFLKQQTPVLITNNN
jgi:phage baseplate assembly protein W